MIINFKYIRIYKIIIKLWDHVKFNVYLYYYICEKLFQTWMWHKYMCSLNYFDVGVEEVFVYELSSYLTTLFDKYGRLSEACKPLLGVRYLQLFVIWHWNHFGFWKYFGIIRTMFSYCKGALWKKGDIFKDNEQYFIILLCEAFKANRIDCVNVLADANVIIPMKELKMPGKPWHVLGEDTDLLMLLPLCVLRDEWIVFQVE